jgi:hypothetical protein
MAYFTVQEFRARFPELIEGKYPDDTVDEYRQLAEAAFEDAAGVAFEPRTATVTTYLASGQAALTLGPKVRTVTAAANDGVDLTSDELADVAVVGTGVVLTNSRAGWTGDVSLTYTWGYDQPPLRVKQAVMMLAKTWMVVGPVDERATQISTVDGPINLSTPGVLGANFGIPEVDATLSQYARRQYVG